jgi:hypothetical protein
VGFRHKPDKPLLDKTQEILREWAREDAPKASPQRNSLIGFLQKYELGGPHLKDSNWWALIPQPAKPAAP